MQKSYVLCLPITNISDSKNLMCENNEHVMSWFPMLQHIQKSYVFKYKDVHVPISNFWHFSIWKSMLYFVAIRNMLYSDIKFCNISRNRMCSNRNMLVFLFQTFQISKSRFSRFIFVKVIPPITLWLFNNQFNDRNNVSLSHKQHFKLGKKLIANILLTSMT